jgi:hypothetical protein
LAPTGTNPRAATNTRFTAFLIALSHPQIT